MELIFGQQELKFFVLAFLHHRQFITAVFADVTCSLKKIKKLLMKFVSGQYSIHCCILNVNRNS